MKKLTSHYYSYRERDDAIMTGEVVAEVRRNNGFSTYFEGKTNNKTV